MNKLIPIALIGGAGYWAWASGLLNNLIAPRDEAGGSIPDESGSTQPTTTTPTGPAPLTTLEAVRRAEQEAGYTSGMLTFDEHNWFYQKVRGIPGPAIEDAFPGVDRAFRMSIEEWWQGVGQAGLRGLV